MNALTRLVAVGNEIQSDIVDLCTKCLKRIRGEYMSRKRRAPRVQLHAMAYIQFNTALPFLMQRLDFN